MTNLINKHLRKEFPTNTTRILNLIIAFAKPNLSKKYVF